MPRTRVRVALALAFLVAGVPPAFAAKTDIVELINGDRITCEIQKLERGKLTVKTDGLGTISIEWNDIQHIASPMRFNVERATGERTFGSLGRGDAGTVDIVGTTATERLALRDIVRLAPLGGTLWRRLDGSVVCGLQLHRGELADAVDARHQRELSQPALVLAAQRRFAADDARRRGPSDAQQPGTAVATLLAAAMGRGRLSRIPAERRTVSGFAHAPGRRCRAHPGAVQPHVGIAPRRRRLHARAIFGRGGREHRRGSGGRSWDWFTFDGRSTNLSTSATTYYALNSGSRVRAELNASFKSDIVGDLYWSINAFESYNSRPPAGQKSGDFGVSATMGWSF